MLLPNLHKPEVHGREETPIRFPTRFSSRLPFLLPFLFFAAAFPAWPQNSQPTQSTEPLKELSLEQLGNIEVTTASKEPVEVWQTPAAIYVITQDDIQRSGARSIPEVLRLAPGVEVARIDGNKWSVGIRGFGSRLSRSVLVLIDGRTVYTTLFAGTYWEVQNVMIEDIDRIEVIRGPGGTIWGPNAVNGVINIITKSSKDTQGTLVSTGGGNEEEGFFDARYGGSNAAKNLDYRVYGMGFSRSPEYHPDGQNFDGWRNVQGGFRMDWAKTDRDAYTLQGDIYDESAGESVNPTMYTPPYSEIVDAAADLSGGNIMGRWKRVLGDGDDVQVLAETAQAISRDQNYSIRATPIGNRDEIAVLIDSFNKMLMEIQKRDTALQESEEQFRTLADSVPQLAWMAEPDGHIFWYNQRWYDYTGTTPEQMKGWGWQSVHDPKVLAEVLERWRGSIATGRRFEMVFPLRGRDGTFREFLTLATPILDAQGRVARWFGTNTDITEQRRSEEALRKSEKLAATGRLAASIAHEINNPLEAVTNLVYLARKNPSNVGTYLKLADHELDRIAHITKNTLGFYRDSASRSEVNVSEVLDEVLVLYSGKLNFKRVKLRSEYPEGIKIVGYAGEVRQIFANLVANAIEALSPEGCLTIRASKVQAGQDGFCRQGVRVTVMDNGSGIAAEDRKKIFEPFYTTKKDVGTGLGLWLTLDLVRKHQGSIRLRSSTQPGRTWTAFSVFLPERPPGN